MSEMTLIYKEQKSQFNTVVFKNYSEITDKPNVNFLDPFDSELQQIVKVYGLGNFKIDKSLCDEESFVKNFANPFAVPHVNRKTIVIEENENKVALKVYTFIKTRGLNKKYFRVRKNITYLTFNFKRKQFFMGELNTKNKKKIGQSLKINQPDLMSSPLLIKLKSENNGIFILQKFLDHIIDRLNIDVNKNQKAQKKYYEIILKLQKIKYPDAFEKFASVFQPVKQVRLSDSNLVTYFMKLRGLKGKKARLLLNMYEKLDINSMITIQTWFGIDVFNKIKNESFLTKNQYNYYTPTNYNNINYNDVYKISKKEIENIISIINTSTTETCLQTIIEHLTFQVDLKKYGEYVKIESKNYDDFVFEHSEISALLQSYRTGYVERYYGDDCDLVEKKIYSNGNTYFPKLLKNTNEYEGESAHQHNCVRTYIEKSHCFIISLRKNDQNGNERATLEYIFYSDHIKRIQSKGKYNSILSNDWDVPMEELDEYVGYLYGKQILKLPVMTKKYKNGKSITKRSVFKEITGSEIKVISMSPCWEDENDETFNFHPTPIDVFDDLPL